MVDTTWTVNNAIQWLFVLCLNWIESLFSCCWWSEDPLSLRLRRVCVWRSGWSVAAARLDDVEGYGTSTCWWVGSWGGGSPMPAAASLALSAAAGLPCPARRPCVGRQSPGQLPGRRRQSGREGLVPARRLGAHPCDPARLYIWWYNRPRSPCSP